MLDPNTDRFVLVVAGIARGGTNAAGEFLIDAHYMDELAHLLPADWNRKNIEVVLETQVIDGSSGRPASTLPLPGNAAVLAQHIVSVSRSCFLRKKVRA